MSLATRCTHCGTIFKVVQDQLKVSDGWVRCGRCNEVFNALPTLFDLDKDPPPPRVTPPSPPAQQPEQPADPLLSQGLLAEPDVDLGFDSQPPVGWERTQPAEFTPPPQQTVNEDELALDPRPIEATTDFELDTSIAVDDNTPLEDVIASVTQSRPPPVREPAHADLTLDITESPRPWLEEPPQDVPSTEEEDALDSRYLMPTPRERKAPRRRDDGPEFADAQFPSDAFLDAEEDWASDFGPSALEADAALPRETRPAPAKASTPATTGLRTAPGLPPAGAGAAAKQGAPATDEGPTTLPSRFADDFTPEQAIEPPSLRKGRPGTRGRDPAQHTPEFVKRAQRKAFWRHPATRSVLSVLALGLVLTLGLQLVHQFRDLVVAYHPASRPLLSQWCATVGCQLAAPLRLEDLQVESATLVRAASEGPDSYRLAVVVHNKSGIDLAWPHVDLTLTDDNGAVIARRVFAPSDAQWLDTADPKADAPAGTPRPVSPSASTPTAAPHQRSTTLQWRLLAPSIQPAGYTAELFYP